MPVPLRESISQENVHQVVKMELSKMTFTDLFKCMKCSITISTGKILQCINGHIFCERCSETLNNCQVCGGVPPAIPCRAIESLRQLLNDTVLQFTSVQPATDDSIETELVVVVKMELSKMTFTDLFKCMECSTTISIGKILQCINGHIFYERCSGTLNNCQVYGEVPLTIPCRAIESLRQLLNDSVLQFTSAQPATDDSIETELDVAVKMELSKMTFTDLFKCMKCSTTISTGKILQCINGHIFCERCSGTLNNCQVCGELPPTLPCRAIESLRELLIDSVLQFTSAQPTTDDSTVTELDMCIGGHQLCDDCSSFLAKGNCGICKKPFGDSRIRCSRLEKLNEIDILMCPNVGCHTELSLFQRVQHLDCCNFRAFPCPFVALSQCSSHLGSVEMEDHLVNAHGAVYSKEVRYKAELVIRKGSISPNCMAFNCFGKLFMLSVVRFPSPEDGVPVFLVYVQFFGDECEAKMYFCSPRIIKEAGEDHSTESFKSILWTGLPYDITSKVFVEADYPSIDGLMFNLNMAQAFDQNLNFLADLYSLNLQFGIRCSGS